MSGFFAALLNNIIATILVSVVGVSAIIAWVTGTLDFLIQILTTPTPLWATTLLVFLCVLYTYVKVVKYLAMSKATDQSSTYPLDLLDDEDVKTLQIIASQEQPFEKNQYIDQRRLPEKLNFSPQKTQHCLDNLLKTNCIHYDTDNYDTLLRGLTDKGRKLLHNKNLLP